jgi:hypothetical protein
MTNFFLDVWELKKLPLKHQICVSKKALFLCVMNVIQTEDHISAATWEIRSEFRPFFRIDPITQKNINFVFGNAKKYGNIGKYADNVMNIMREIAHMYHAIIYWIQSWQPEGRLGWGFSFGDCGQD